MWRTVLVILVFTLAVGSDQAQAAGDHAEAWLQNTPEGFAIFAEGMTPGRPCSLNLTRASGQVCSISGTDALGGTMETDASGRLITRRAGFADDLPMAWACLAGTCAGGVALSACHATVDPLERALLSCGSTQTSVLVGPQSVGPPPSAGLSLQLPGAAKAPSTFAYFDIIPTLQFGDAAPQPLCTVVVGINAGDDEATVLGHARDTINQSPDCMAGGVSADLTNAGLPPRLVLTAPDLVAAQLIPVVHAAPGEADAHCFSLSDLGPPSVSQSQVMALEFQTAAGGAMGGGEITVVEHSPVGTCSVVTPTSAGQSAAVLVRNIRLGFQTSGVPGPASCPASQNPRDVRFIGNRIITTLPSEVEVCVDDPGVGFTMKPEGLGNAPPGAHCDDLVVECTEDGQAQVILDASDSSDPEGNPLLAFNWYENYGGADETFLGQGETLAYPFAYGDHHVSVIVFDSLEQRAVGNCHVRVADTTPPTIFDAAIHPATLYPPNHEMVDVTAAIEAFDTCGATHATLVSLVSSEPDDAPGPSDGATTHDIQDAALNTADLQFRLRAERDSDGEGRAYTAVYNVTDDAGNAMPAELTVRVPPDVGGVVDPLAVSVGKGTDPTGAPAVDVLWTDAGGDREYNVIRGDVRNITETDNHYYLGPVDCLEVRTRVTRTQDVRPTAVGEASFYLVESVMANALVVASGYSSADLLKPRTADPCIPLPGGPIPDPERDSIVSTGWGWLTGVSGQQVGAHLANFGERLVDIDRLGPNLYQSVQVANAGSTYGTPAFWWNDQTEADVVLNLQATSGRILDLDPYEVNGQTRFSVSIIPNTGKRAKTWWWNYDLTPEQVVDAIDTFGLRIIDLDAYQVGGVTRYSYVGVLNQGVDAKGWWLYFNISFSEVSQALADNNARLMDIEAHPNGNFTVVMVANDGKAWWWGAGLTAERVGTFVDNKGSRLIDLERIGTMGTPTYAFISIDNVNTEESRRLRPIMEGAFDQAGFGPFVTRGFLVKESSGPTLADIAGGLPFQPASTLKLLPYLYAIEEVDQGQATLDGSTVTWLQDNNDEYAACQNTGTQASASYRDALPTMMWYSHNRTLDAFFDEYHPVNVLTPRAQDAWGMPNTVMYLGCTDEWLNNRSTLYEFATMFERVQNLTLPLSASSRQIFWNNMINQMRGNCAANIPGSPGCTCPAYEPDCAGNFYDSPYINMDGPDPDTMPDVVGPATVDYLLLSIVQQEGGGGFPVDDFLNQVLIRQKGGGASVPDYPVAGFWDGYRSIAMYATLPFKDGGGNIVPRRFTVAFFVNNWDGLCGGAVEPSQSCKDTIAGEDSEAFVTVLAELFRLPIRMAVQSW